MARITQMTPFIQTHNLGASLAFFKDIMGFECTFRADNYAFIRRGEIALRVLEVDCEIGEQMVYFDVDDVDALYAEMRESLETLEAGRVRAPFDQPYDQREFHLKDPDNCLFFFGQPTPQPADPT